MQARYGWLLVGLTMTVAVLPGCTRRDYRLRADRDAYALMAEKSMGTPWQLPPDYSVYPNPASRLADPTNPDFPSLPSPGPILYGPVEPDSPEGEAVPPPEPARLDAQARLRRLPNARPNPAAVPQEIPHEITSNAIQLASFQEPVAPPEPLPPPEPNMNTAEDGASGLSSKPIPPAYWNALPKSCLRQLAEFPSIQEEYARSRMGNLSQQVDSPARRLDLNEIVRLAWQNSRDYQSNKEELYLAALAVSLERFDYQLKFTPTGNGSDVLYSHRRSDGTSQSGLSVLSGFGVERMLATGGTFIGRFANDVVLTFNGDDGFTSDISSDVVFQLSQRFLQRDILFEPLIQSERRLVYAARSFTRERKRIFFEIASQYYGILRTYRRIEIESQNYFSLVRVLEQAQAEVRADVSTAPNQVAVDQFEQGMLRGRSFVISTSNDLQRSLDTLKLTMGLPTDMPIAVSLNELEQLTLQDETAVALERVRRWRARVVRELGMPYVRRFDLLNADFFMTERLLQWIDLKRQLDPSFEADSSLDAIYQRLQLEQAHVEVERTRDEYLGVAGSTTRQSAVLVYLRATSYLENHLNLVDLQLKQLSGQDNAELRRIRQRWSEIWSALKRTRETLANDPASAQVDDLVTDLRPLLEETEQLSRSLDAQLGYNRDANEETEDAEALALTDRLLNITNALVDNASDGLPEIDIDANEAMLTALIQRLDMMNARGELADDWRQIKYAGDDLRSVFNLDADQVLSNRQGNRNLGDFSFDSSSTTVRLTLDLPLNRRVQRNLYRRALINYQAGRRSVMALEDSIKFDIRNGLRNLELRRVQYPISVTSAALAAEQVISIQLQLALGTPDVRGRDLLDALQGSREALTSVANERIGYLIDRARFVFDLELMELDDNGYWSAINDTDYQPIPNLLYPPSAGPTYGYLPAWIKPSKLMYHIYCHPRPGERIEVINQDNVLPRDSMPSADSMPAPQPAPDESAETSASHDDAELFEVVR